MLILAILLIKFGITTLIILGALFFVATSLLPRNIDINQFFKGFSGVEFGSGARYQQYYNNTSSAANGDTLEQEEAYKILGLKGGESKEEINKAYKKMMARFHPDKEGGSEYFAQKINQARDVLLKKYAK
ncbi:MAG: DnaJ domain-containing protein [Alphaproteobacteria bacterium]|nr:DnaJ domain-containing protein [Alphaproteobacteria bacterium]